MSTRLLRLVFTFLVVVTSAIPAAADAPAPKPSPVALTPAQLAWDPVPVIPGMMQARVWGPADGAQGRFVRIPPNGKLPLHRHTATVRVVVVSGTYVYGVQGEPERGYGAGSFVVTPGGVAHVAGCSDACLYYEDVDGRPDYQPVATR